MSAIIDCPACESGNHDRHVGPWNVRPGLIGGAACDCTGECAERHEKRIVELKAMFAGLSEARPAIVADPVREADLMALRMACEDRDAARAALAKIEALCVNAQHQIGDILVVSVPAIRRATDSLEAR